MNIVKHKIVSNNYLFGNFDREIKTKCGRKLFWQSTDLQTMNQFGRECKICFNIPKDYESNKIPIEKNTKQNIKDLKKIKLICPSCEKPLVPSNDLDCPDKYNCITKSCKISWLRIKMR